MVHKPWEVAKCYMPYGYKHIKSAAKTDFNGLVNVVIHHMEINSKVDIIESFDKGREVSNAIRHSPTLEIDDEDLQTYFDVFEKILRDNVCIASYTSAQNALDKLLKLRQDKHDIEIDSIMKILDEKEDVETNEQNLQLLKATKQGLSEETVQTQISAHTLETTVSYVTKLTAFREDLITFYKEIHSNIPISPLVSENDVPVADFYVQQKMHQVDYSLLGKHTTHRNDIDTFEAMFMNGSTLCRNIFIMAKAGAGKTTFAKRVCNVWCYTKSREGNEPQNISESATNTLNQFDILCLLLLRDVQGNECDIDEMIQSQIIKYLSRSSDYDDAFLRKVFHQQTCLIILDGLDEWSHPIGTTCQNIKHIPHHKSRANCTILSTTQPWKMFESEIRNSMIDKCIELGQFDDSSSDILISNVIDTCTDEHESEKRKTKDFKGQIKEHNLDWLISTPVILIQLIFLWLKNKTLGKSKCQIYSNIIDFLLERAEEKNKQENVPSPVIYKREGAEEKNKQEQVSSSVIYGREGAEEKNKQENVTSPAIYQREGADEKNKQEKVTSRVIYMREGAEKKNKQENVTSPVIYKDEGAEEKNKQKNVTSPVIYKREGAEEKNKQEIVTSPVIYKREGAKNDEQFNCLKQKIFCQKYNYLLVAVGKLAFRALFSETRERSLVFESTLVKETLSREELNDCLHVGILTENRTNNLIARQINFSFIHKTFQEYFCALYIAAVERKSGTNDVLRRCQSIESIIELSGVFVFLSGLCPNVLNIISAILAETITKDKICQDFRRKICTSINWSTDYKILKEFQDMNIDCIQESIAENTESVNIIQEDIVIDGNCCSESYNEHLKALISMNKDNMKSVKIYGKPGSAVRSYIDDFNLIGLKHLDKLEMSVDKVNDGDLNLLLLGSTDTLKCLSVCKDIGSQIDPSCEPLSNSCVRTIQQMSNLEAIMLECFTIDHELLQDLFCFLEKKRNMTEICLANIKCRAHDCNCTGFTLDLSKHSSLNMLEIGNIPLYEIKVNTKSLHECRVGHFNSHKVLPAILCCLQEEASDLQSLMCFGISRPGELEAVLNTLPSLRTLHVLVMKRINIGDHVIDIQSPLQHIKLSSVQMSSSVLDSILRAAEDHPSSLTCELLWCEVIPEHEYCKINDYIQKSEKIDILYEGKKKNNTIKLKFRSKAKP